MFNYLRFPLGILLVLSQNQAVLFQPGLAKVCRLIQLYLWLKTGNFTNEGQREGGSLILYLYNTKS